MLTNPQAMTFQKINIAVYHQHKSDKIGHEILQYHLRGKSKSSILFNDLICRGNSNQGSHIYHSECHGSVDILHRSQDSPGRLLKSCTVQWSLLFSFLPKCVL